jgi:Amt family ammonium transporter
MATAADNALAIDALWKAVGTVLVFWMHAGFSLLEAGNIRKENINNIFFKNMLNVILTTVTWWLWGYALAFGASNTNGFIGGDGVTGYAGHHLDSAEDMIFWAFQWAFAATAVTIISGGMAERANCWGYIVLICIFQIIIYPVITCWVWNGQGWLAVNGFNDYAGSGVVHMVGGFASATGCYFLGGRKGTKERHSISHIVLGTFILWMGWYGFNAVSSDIAAPSDRLTAMKIMMNTTISASVSGVVTLFANYFFMTERKFHVHEMCNGVLAGLVGITANCAYVTSWAAFCIGAIAPLFYFAGLRILKMLDIDDAIGAFPVHGAAGVWGLIATGFFHEQKGLFYFSNFANNQTNFGWQCIGTCAIIGWTVTWTACIVLGCKAMGILRVPEDHESKGLDYHYHD